MDADGMVEIGGLMFRDVKDGDQCPFDFHTQAPEVLRWLCPSLSMAEAAALVKKGNGLNATVANLRALVVDGLAEVRASGSTLPPSEARSYTLQDVEPREERVNRVAQQIVADATETSIGEAIPWSEARSVEPHAETGVGRV